MSSDLANSEWMAFITTLETAEEEFVQGQPAAFQALWSHADDVTLCGGFGGVERGWQNVNGSAELGQCEIFEWHSDQGGNKQDGWRRVCLSRTDGNHSFAIGFSE